MISNNFLLLLLYFFLFSVYSANLITQLQCVDSSECGCFQEFKRIELTCPPHQEFPNMTVHISERDKPSEWLMKIDCYDCEDFVDMLPNMKIPLVTHIKLQSCPLPPNGFSYLLEKFNITHLQQLDFGIYKSKPLALKKNLFNGMELISELIFNSNDIESIDEDIFEDLPHLEYLDLRNNNVSLYTSLFKYAENLKALDISENNIEYIPDGIFKTLHKLELLDIWSNKITKLVENSFLGLDNLLYLEMSNNKIRDIDENAFSHLRKISNISLNYNEIQSLPKELFKTTKPLKLLVLSNNNLEEIPENVFAECTNLINLNLSNNKLRRIPRGVFRNISSLEILDLHGNYIIELSDGAFEDLKKLRSIQLQGNSLKQIQHHMFTGLTRVTNIDLSRNALTEITMNSDIHSFLEVLDLSDNNLPDIDFQDFMMLYGNLRKLDLSNNMFTEVDLSQFVPIILTKKDLEVNLSHNNITRIAVTKYDNVSSSPPYTTVSIDLSYNPIVCDCEIFTLMKYFKEDNSLFNKVVHVSPDGLTCDEPTIWRGLRISELPLQKFICSSSSLNNCSLNCGCSWRPYDETVIVNCANKSLSELPDIRLFSNYKNLEIDLTGNLLEELSKKEDYDNFHIRELTLSSNAIENVTWIPPNIEVLKLDNNRIRRLDYQVLENLKSSKSLVNLTLHNNSWICDCQAKNFSSFLRSNLEKVDAFNVFCENTHEAIISLNEGYLCYKSTMSLVVSVSVVALTLTFMMLLAVLCYNFRRDIKIWLFSKNLCLECISEQDLDKDKEYDAFISFSHKDGDFIENMVEILENGPCSYKLCLHYRDWVPGEYIASQIINSVQNSKRTIIVLSSNFLESVWAKMEFQTAHLQAIKERRAKVIIILYGNVDTDQLDEELKLYLKINTYVKWGDPWFWNKLRYALPHENKKKQLNAQKHANMMMSIEKQFSSKQPLHERQIAPVLPLDAESLLKHPLNFISRSTTEDCDKL